MQPAPPGASTCSTCGGVLEETPGGGLGCMSCLLRAGIGSEEETVHDSTPDALDSGMRFGVYEIDCREDGRLYELGRGAMGVTYRATDTTLQRKVALKIIQTDIAERSADARERFMREARAAAALRHENIATIHQFGMRLETGQYFYAMELIEGETLEERVRRAGPLDARTTIQIAQQVTSALAAAEKHGVIHRDLKPANLMLISPDGETSNNKKLLVKIIDFGLAKAIHTETDPKSLTHDRFVGTPAFASPEQFEHAALDVRSDIYSLGETLWFALTGKTPFAGHTLLEIHRAQKSNALPVEQLKAAHVPFRLRSVLGSMLAFEPASRPGTGELAARLQRCSHEARSVRRTRLALAAAALVILGMSALFVFQPSRIQNAALNAALEKSIAVLPFENRSEDKANAYFADGIQDEILTLLSKIADLKVISRTSTQQYQSKPANLREIAKQLGVANILEGSVQKSADQVRVNVQLVNAQTDSHLWAHTYDRKLTDIFGVESEIAKRIAESLQAKLTGREEQALGVKPTNNPEAYDAYLRGVAFEARFSSSFNHRDFGRKAVSFFEQAVQLDPNFALAWARLSRADAMLYANRSDTAEVAEVARIDAAKRALEVAQKLEPNSPETLLALGYYQLWVLQDYGLAKTTFSRVSKLLPSSSEVPYALARVTLHEGQLDQSVAYFEQAIALDPRNVEVLNDTAWTFATLRQLPAALKLYDRVLDITPNDPNMMAAKAGIYQAEGNLPEAARSLPEINWPFFPWHTFVVKMTQLRLERNYGELIRLLQTRVAQFHFDLETDRASDQVWLALTQRLAGDTASANVSAEQARNTFEEAFRDRPDHLLRLEGLSKAHALTEEKELAIKEAERAVMLVPRAKDPQGVPSLEENVAVIQTIFGEDSRAISILTRLLQTPYDSPMYPFVLTPALLRLDPIWDPLRADPAFQKLCQEKVDKSIAVLPFENLSEDKANAYFAEGIQDEILTRLSKLADLKVISRTSTQHYKSAPENLPEIARQLGVAHILEGRVQKSGDAVRVNVQLIKAADDSHLWADTYDRKLTDIFSVESEVAKAIADQLRAKLTGEEEQVIAAKPTDNPEAYDAYLRGLAYTLKTGFTSANSFGAQKYLKEAVRLDPKFALGWALLSFVDSRGYFTAALQPTVALREEARQAAETALTLQPDLGEAILAKGYYYYFWQKDYDAGVRYFEHARQLLPNSSKIPESLALVARRRGQWDKSEAYFDEAERLDPRNVNLLTSRVLSYICLRRFPEGLRKLEQILDITPDDLDTLATKAAIAQAEGDLPRASALLAPLHPRADDTIALETQVYQAILERRPAQITPRLKEILDTPDPALGHWTGELRFWLGWAQEVAGDHAAAQESWRQARSELEPLLKEQPENNRVIGYLALINAGLGDKAAALALSGRGLAANPIEKDAISGTAPIEILARVAAQMGEPDRAIAAVQKLLSTPGGGALASYMPLTPALLRLDPMFDPLRSDPRFQKLAAAPR